MSKDESVVEKALDLGSTYFKSGNYSKAKDLFVKAIKVSYSYDKSELKKLRLEANLPPVALHDPKKIYHPRLHKLYGNLSATYDKLQNLDKASDCSQRMINVDPYNLKGYIMMGKILQKQNKDKLAYKAYKNGLKQAHYAVEKFHLEIPKHLFDIVNRQKDLVRARLVSTGQIIKEDQNSGESPKNEEGMQTPGYKRVFIDPVEEQLKKRRKENENKFGSNIIVISDEQSDNDNLVPKELKYIDFVSELPLEVLPLIFSHFNTKDIVKFCFVSTNWNKRIKALVDIFKYFDLNNISYQQAVAFTKFYEQLYKQVLGNKSIRLVDTIKFSSKIRSDELRIMKILLKYILKSTRQVILTIPNTVLPQINAFINNSHHVHVEELSLMASFQIDKPFELDLIEKFPNLKKLEFIIPSAISPIANSNYGTYQLSEVHTYPACMDTLESMKIICDNAKVKHLPLFSILKFSKIPNLRYLCVTGAKFNDTSDSQFDWLGEFSNLEEIWMENNENASLSSFLKSCCRIKMSSNLKKLTFREYKISSKFELNTINPIFENNFRNLESLDIMGSSICGRAVLDIVSVVKNNSIYSLNIGECPYIQFSVHLGSQDVSLLSIPYLLSMVPNLKELYIPQLGSLNDTTMHILTSYTSELQNLVICDLSFNPSLTGAAVYDFLQSLKKVRKRPLENFVINGCPEISHITSLALKSQNLVTNLECIYQRPAWKQFGLNSYRFKT
ncbi:hypothetical protein TPHA_0G00430 [Tetrapisispora phaffii CBS 4417]|uniref:F-box domain-containing protein n=1 Tax=Tetrapisispora phaffii (strain ATCC 24235 / CBS 4417 / NBRC 1672 / NRRL Y-8282 / UCD 70-5) TaxID=1071381 RepID=G8BVF1_TETPH|nr:hypothetical protein TPHA_0G00430 [Tetrapisispora phaffii CBS 4417]CCE63879.1 hypothetical protein TPHA_0G00430 [Tetrapisispora phaffii CBS 4417]